MGVVDRYHNAMPEPTLCLMCVPRTNVLRRLEGNTDKLADKANANMVQPLGAEKSKEGTNKSKV
jgi:hypothetical protein